MAEFASAIIGIAAAALHSSNVLIELISKIKKAPREIGHLKRDVSNIARVLTSLDASLSSNRIRENLKFDPEVVRAVQNLRGPLEDCSATYNRLVEKLSGIIKRAKDEPDQYAISTSSRLKWYLFRSELNDMLANVDRSKGTLHTAINALILICVINAAHNDSVQNIEKPPNADNDVGTALRYYAESIHHARSVKEARTTVNCSSNPWPSQSNDAQQAASSIQTPYDLSNVKSEQLQRAGNQHRGLRQAAREDDYTLIEIFIGEGVDINARDPTGKTALHIAAEHGNVTSVHVLQRHGVELNIETYSKGIGRDRDIWGRATALYLACSHGHSEVVQILLDAGADVNSRNCSMRTPLMQAARGGHSACVEQLLDHGADHMIRDINEFTPLHEASYSGVFGCLATQQILLDRGAHINASTYKLFSGSTPLHLAVKGNHMECVRELVKRGANIEARNNYRCTPAHEAAFHNHTSDILRILVNDGGANIKASDHRHETPLHKAVAGNKADNVRFLLLKGADAYARDEDSCDVIQLAMLKNDQGVLRGLRNALPNDPVLNNHKSMDAPKDSSNNDGVTKTGDSMACAAGAN